MSNAFTQVCPGVTSEARTLRRRRSAASAALLSRPSMLTLGELVPSFETCVLVYASISPTAPDAMDDGEQAVPKLIYALFEPNFLVDGASGTIRKLDRTSWERLRSHVEELRIVALSSRYGDELTTPPNSPISPIAPVRKPDCVFDLSMPADDSSKRSVTQLYLQPNSYASIPARSRDELLEIEIHGPNDAGLAEERRICLPTQVRAVLHDAEQLMNNQSPTPLSAPPNMEDRKIGGQNNGDFGTVCARILELVQNPRCASYHRIEHWHSLY